MSYSVVVTKALGSEDERDPGPWWLTSLDKTAHYSSRDSVSKTKIDSNGEGHLTLTSILNICRYEYA